MGQWGRSMEKLTRPGSQNGSRQARLARRVCFCFCALPRVPYAIFISLTKRRHYWPRWLILIDVIIYCNLVSFLPVRDWHVGQPGLSGG
jgi:hypothetical protein